MSSFCPNPTTLNPFKYNICWQFDATHQYCQYCSKMGRTVNDVAVYRSPTFPFQHIPRVDIKVKVNFILSHVHIPPASNVLIYFQVETNAIKHIPCRNILQLKVLPHQIQRQQFCTYRYALLPIQFKGKNDEVFVFIVKKTFPTLVPSKLGLHLFYGKPLLSSTGSGVYW